LRTAAGRHRDPGGWRNLQRHALPDELSRDIPAALTLLATVVSRQTLARIIINAGKKAMSSNAAVPMPLGVAAKRVALSAEHGTIELAEPSLSAMAMITFPRRLSAPP